jgi:hypothetical protein
MLMTPERRYSDRARIPCHIPVELTDAARAAQFEADAVDLSVGGLSLRAAQLPDLGSQLFCAFEAMPGGAQVLGRGEVVWRQPSGEQGGEFGLRFIEVDARNQALIDEMVAERIARISRPEKVVEPVLATLEIENVDEPMTARLVHTGDTQALFEQQLSHFAIGKAVIAHAGASLVRGHVASVEIRMEGTTPRLVINLEVARDSAHFGEFMWGEPGSDTAPDVFAQTQAKADAGPSALAATAAESQPDSEPLPSALELDAQDQHDEHTEADDAGSTGTLAGLGAPVPLPAPIRARQEPEAQQLPLFRRDHQQRATAPELGTLHLNGEDAPSEERPSFAPDNVYVDEQRAQELLGTSERPPAAPYDDEESLEEVHAVSLAASKEFAAHETEEIEVPTNGPLVSALRVFAMLSEGFQRGAEHVREWASGVREDANARSAGTVRLFGPKPRRVTASTHRIEGHNKQNLRVIAIGSLCILALVVFAYALTPSGDEPIPHQDMRGEQAVDPLDSEGDTETSEASALAAAPSELPAQEPPSNGNEHALAVDKRQPARTSAPSVAEKRPRPSEATLVARAATPAAAAPSAGTMSYGQKQVPNGRRFLLRMTEPVRTLLGTSNPNGFSVVIMDNKALDKAAPISVGHPAVEQAFILNRRDHSAELTVRFAPGKTPAYRVSGQGSMLEVLIAQ